MHDLTLKMRNQKDNSAKNAIVKKSWVSLISGYFQFQMYHEPLFCVLILLSFPFYPTYGNHSPFLSNLRYSNFPY